VPEIGFAGDDQIGMAADRQHQEFVGVAAIYILVYDAVSALD
jgi:hypothetical protein